MSTYFARSALLPGGVAENVLFTVDGGRISHIEVAAEPGSATVLAGLVVPGFANAHSHAFHRALRGRTHDGGGTFWTWREQMYRIAAALDPDSYYELARGVYGEMVLAGYTSVGEFHYLHHAPGGKPYAERNAMGEALRGAAKHAGIRLTLLDTCYLAGGIGQPLSHTQQRFSDGTADGWAARVAELAGDETTVIGGAVHSVRAVPAGQLATVAAATAGPLHVHLSEQQAENDQCLEAYGKTPTELLAGNGILDERTSLVHATHLTSADIATIGEHRCTACFCPSTEADLADGIGPARELVDAGARLSLGSDQHAAIDPLLELQRLEGGERLRTGHRGRFTPAELSTAAFADGHRSLGWDAGRLETGALADFLCLRTNSVRTAGTLPEQMLLAATAADVDTVVVGGKIIVRNGQHGRLGDVGALLHNACESLA
jgi:formiminoglutamate deiminase